jgi:hypothetical protein
LSSDCWALTPAAAKKMKTKSSKQVLFRIMVVLCPKLGLKNEGDIDSTLLVEGKLPYGSAV